MSSQRWSWSVREAAGPAPEDGEDEDEQGELADTPHTEQVQRLAAEAALRYRTLLRRLSQ